MSGGHFDYKQYQIEEIANKIEYLIDNNNIEGTLGFTYDYPEEVLEKFREALHECNRVINMVQRIDWLVSGDDGVETFFKRWDQEVGAPYTKR